MSPVEQQLLLASGQLVSISQIAPYTPYSAEYLSLLARKGKVKAVKVSRDWLTTPFAVADYIKNQEKKHREKHQKIVHSLRQIKSHLPSVGVTQKEESK